MHEVVLVFLRRSQEVLLGIKQKGFGQGKLVAVGGHIEAGETAVQAATREFLEETSVQIKPTDLIEIARVEFVFIAQPNWHMRAVVFEAWQWQGIPIISPEIAPEWIEVAALPLERMWDDAQYWVAQVLAGQRFDAYLEYGTDNAVVQKAQLTPWRK